MKRGWYEINEGEYVLTPKAIMKEFNLTEEQLRNFLRTYHGSRVENFWWYTQFGTSKRVRVWKLNELRRYLEK